MFVTMMLIAALCGSLASADSMTVPTSVQVDVGPNVDAMLRDLAEQIGVGAEAVYPLYLRQADVFADMCVTVLIIGGILLVILTALAFVCQRKIDTLCDDGGMIPGMAAILLLLSLVIACLMAAPDYVTARSNPELWAIQHIARDAAGLVQ